MNMANNFQGDKTKKECIENIQRKIDERFNKK